MKVVIADDHSIFRTGLELLISNSFSDVEIVSFSNGKEVVDYFLAHTADIMILDITMPILDGLGACKALKNNPAKKILLTMHNELELVKLAISNGVKGYILKENTSEDLIECMNTVLAGGTFLSRDIDYYSEQNSNVDVNSEYERLNRLLSSTEINILKQISLKKTSKEISDLLFISLKTVENYRSKICKKIELDARNNSLMIWVMENKSLVNSL